MIGRAFFDTNILLYAAEVDPEDGEKGAVAVSLMDREQGGLSVQVLQEFFTQATRPSRKQPLPIDAAMRFIESWRRFPVQDLTIAIFDSALGIHLRHRFSYWDSAIIAAARALGCETLYSEDMSHGRSIEGLTIINPFQR